MKTRGVLMLNLSFNFVNIIVSETFNETNFRLFEFYKAKYDKKYESEAEEQIAFSNFVNNLKKVTNLNDHTINSTYYVLDRYGDVDTADMEERYAVTVNPIDKEPLGNFEADIAEEIKRNKTEKILENTKLYDLTRAAELYESYLHQYHKTTPRSQYKQQIHFLRFVKSMVNVNRNHINGDGEAYLDDKADVVQYPHEFFY